MLPLPDDSLTIRKWPTITMALVIACVVGTVAERISSPEHAQEARSANTEVVEYQAARSHLQLPTALDPSLHGETAVEDLDIVAAGNSLPPDRSDIRDPGVRSEQEELDDKVRALVRTCESAPTRRFGFVPSKTSFLGLATYPFIQNGWLQVALNAWFLWLCGCAIENRWRRWIYAPFIVGVAVVGAFAHKAFGSSPELPLLGVEAVIAGGLGAVAVSLGSKRIPFAAVGLAGARVVHIPAWVMLPVWAGIQVLLALTLAKGGMAPFAQIGGAAFGVLVALVLRSTGAEKRLDPDHGQPSGAKQDERVVRAGELVAAGRPMDAIELLRLVAEDQPSNIDVQLEMLRAAKAAGDAAREMIAYGRLIELYMRSGATNTAMELYIEVKVLGREDELDAGNRVRVAERLAERDRLHEAAEVFARVYEPGIHDMNAIRALIGHARVSVRLGRVEEARSMLDQAKQSPFSTREMDERVERELANLPNR